MDITNINFEELENIFSERKQGKPLQYILNISEFMGEKFFVNENVLIPRPETEILINKVIDIAKTIQNPEILDIGTGSGCIPIIVKKIIPISDIYSCDISDEAIKIAKVNANNIDTNIHFIKSDLFQNINMKFDIIVSNPPYIPPNEKPYIQKEVTFEPDLALYTNDLKGIEFYRKIIANASEYLNTKGYLCFEK